MTSLTRYNLLPVDWMGNPLTSSTVPDYYSITKLHYRVPIYDSGTSKAGKCLPCLRETEQVDKESFHRQFADASCVAKDIPFRGPNGGFQQKDNRLNDVLVHPKTSVWDLPTRHVDMIKKNDPMEFLNLIDPNNVITTERAYLSCLLNDVGEIGFNVSMGSTSECCSGFTNNYKPYLPLPEDRDFRSVYRQTYRAESESKHIDGLQYPKRDYLAYPGYSGGTTMRDFPSAFEKFGENFLKSSPKFT